MKRVFSFIVGLFVVYSVAAQTSYVPDILGDGFEQHTFVMPDDYHGKVTATLIRKLSSCDSRRAVLYVHGYNDYFFQSEMAQQYVDSCFNFYAVDLRKYGRSILPGQYPFEVREINEYFAEIDSAVQVIRQEGNTEIVLMGHSTGGLITSLYCSYYRDNLPVDALILNSPFLEWNFNAFYRNFLIPVVSWLGSMMPDKTLGDEKHPSIYGQSLLKEYHGEWSFNTDWKMLMTPGQRFSWVRAIDKGHAKVHKGLDIPCPILLMHSDKSVYGDEWNEDFQRGDAVLNVEHIAKYGRTLGPDVTEVTVVDGLHDLVLSRSDVRNFVYAEIFAWLQVNNLMTNENKQD